MTLFVNAIGFWVIWLVSLCRKFISLYYDTPHHAKVTRAQTPLFVTRFNSESCTFRHVVMEQRAGWYWIWVLQPHNRTPGCIPKSATFTFKPRVKQWGLCWLISWAWHYEGYQNKAKEISYTVILVISPQTQ